MLNNPINASDPSGHDGIPAGNQIQLNIAFGINIKSLFLVFYSVSLVTDNKGGYQLYLTKRDQEYKEGTKSKGGEFAPGPAEEKYKTEMFAIGGISLTYGAIEGSDFRERGTLAYRGRAVNDFVVGAGMASFDHYEGFNEITQRRDPTALRGWDAGIGFGGPFTIGSVSTSAMPISDRHELPSWLLPGCQGIGMCGSLPPPISYIETSRKSIKKINDWITNKVTRNIGILNIE